MTSALEGIKVLDITGMGPASYAAQILGDMGAEVIKISQPPKNASRGVGQGVEFLEGMDASVSFDTLRNKKNMGINLKTEAGHGLFSRMAETSDVILESFRPGVMDRLGLGYEEMARINPRIIYCSVSGYGQDSPYRDLPGHDANYAGMGGALGIIGSSKDAPPVFAQNIVADFTTAILQAAIGILLAVCARERTGRGQSVDISMTDGALSTLNIVPEAMDFLIRGVVSKRGEGLFSGTQPWYSAYQTSDDKYLTLCPLEPHFWQNMCRAIDREDLIARQYSQEHDEIFEELRPIFRSKTRDEWFDLLARADVPVGKVMDVDEVFSEPNVIHRQMVVEVDHPRYGKMKQLGFPIKFSDTPWQIQVPPARLGEHTDEVVSALGYSPEEIKQMREDGDIC
ncbi:MAG: CoA transferase [Deltaproteobacteria bacterium]|nr:CoA transferase [Deltaproteobacteria bacterium]